VSIDINILDGYETFSYYEGHMDTIFLIINILFWFVVILIPLVAIHEFGHLLFARLTGVKVLEFGIGIPPRTKIYKRWKGIIWSLNYTLLGGFARIYGDHDAIDDAHETAKIDEKLARETYKVDRLRELIANDELQFFYEDNNIEYTQTVKDMISCGFLEAKNSQTLDVDTQKGYEAALKQLATLIDWEYDTKISSKEVFYNKNLFQKILILMGGITFNLITAFVIFFLLVGVIGTQAQPMLLDDYNEVKKSANIVTKSEFLTVFSVIKDSNAYNAGLRGGDMLLEFAGRDLATIQDFTDFKNLIDSNKGQTVPLNYIKKTSGEKIQTQISLTETAGKPLFGVDSQGFGYMVEFRAKDIGSGLSLAASQTTNMFLLNFQVLGRILQALNPFAQDRTALQYVGGPVAVGNIGQRIFDFQGYKGILNIMAALSVGLAAFNLLPLPALDGGRMVIVIFSRIFGRRNKKWEALLINVTMFALLGAGVLIAVNDIFKISQGRLF
jgi:regulator of sigma E protease